MLSNQNAIVFVHANWSSASVIAKREFEEFQIDWKLHNSDARNRFYLIDHSKLTPDWLFEWGKSDGMLGLIHNGYGESIWIKDGKAKLRITGHQIKSDELPGMTEKAFE